MKFTPAALALLVSVARLAGAQTTDEVQLSIGGYELAATGPEKAVGVWRVTGSLVIGKPVVGLFSLRGCGYFTLTVPPNAFEQDAAVAWRVEVTPIRVVNHAVTFRLRWVRALDKGGGLTPASEDIEVTLRPGESRPLDSVPVNRSGATTFDGRPCDTKAASLRVLADFPDLDRRLVGMDVWLVERLPNGKEESQLQSVRGLPHRAISFYFDGLQLGTTRLDVFGTLIADPQQGSMDVALQTVRGQADPGQDGYQSAGWFRSTVRLKPDEIVEVALPQAEPKTNPFANRVLSLRIRARHIR